MNYKYDISIVMSYHNRKYQLTNTLNKFSVLYLNKYKFEVIIVNDGSDELFNLDNIIDKYDFPIKLINIDKKIKQNRINSCISYNIGFKYTEGKIILIQNPECFHVGDILKFVLKYSTKNNYITFSCYNTKNIKLNNLLIHNPKLINNKKFNILNKKDNTIWYNHPIYRKKYYHFCSAIYKENLDKIGGFNEKFQYGYEYEDDELVLKIKRELKLKMYIINPTYCFVIHQYHKKDYIKNISKKILKLKREYNKKIYDYIFYSK